MLESKEHWRSVVQTAVDAIITTDENGLITSWNNSAECLFGYSEADALNKPVSFLMPSELGEWTLAKIKGYVSSGSSGAVGSIMEGRAKRKDGAEFPVELSLASWEVSGQTFFTGIVRDISRRKKAEGTIQLFSKAVEEAIDGVQIVNLEGVVIYSNRAMEEIYGFSAAEFVGRHVNSMNVDPSFAEREILPAIVEKGRWQGEFMVLHKSGKKFPVWLSASMVKDEQGSPIAMVGIIRDITEKKNVENELRSHRHNLEELVADRTAELQTAILCLTDEINSRKNAEATIRENEAKIRHMHGMKMIGEMASAVAHEVRNPLHALLAVTEALKQELGDQAELHVYLQHINDQVQRLSALMKDLLDLGKPIEPSHLKQESLSEIFSTAVELWKHMPLGQARSVGLEMPEDHAKIRVMADGQRLQQVFLNLLDNAAHHSSPDSRIRIILAPPAGDSVRVRVTDEGTGIRPEFLPKVFDPFFSTRRGGTGLGLNIVKNIVESHGGTLSLTNNTPLPGCTAEIMLPAPAPREYRHATSYSSRR